ncbi:hypothetical protein cypCar_00045517, partial [Cyprinus carpio]
IPAVLVGSLLSVQQLSRPFYGAIGVTLSNSNATNAVCWITEPLILYGVNLSYFTIIFVFNTIVLITVSRQIFKLKKVDNKHKKIPVKDASTVLGLMCLMGTSWGLVFLCSGYTSYPILYIFCISNTMQEPNQTGKQPAPEAGQRPKDPPQNQSILVQHLIKACDQLSTPSTVNRLEYNLSCLGVKDIWEDRVLGAPGLCRETHGVEVVGLLAACCILTLDL